MIVETVNAISASIVSVITSLTGLIAAIVALMDSRRQLRRVNEQATRAGISEVNKMNLGVAQSLTKLKRRA